MAASRRIEDVLHEMGLGHLVAKFQEQQVTAEMVPLLNEEELSSLGICLIGQRYELKRLCTVSATCTSKDENSDILQLMRQIGAKRTVTTKPKQRPLSTKSSAVHDEVDHMKMIKFLAGWKHRDSESDRHEGPYKHMYIQKGGGTYSLEGDAEDDWDFMLARLKSLFFPNGKNGPFSLEELKCSLGNYVGDEIPRVSKSQDGSAQPFQLSTYSLLTGKQKIRIYLLTSSIKPKKKSRKRGAHTVTIPDDSDDDDFLLVNPFTAHANDRPTKTTKPDDPEISIDPDISIDPEISIGMPHTGPNLDALTPKMNAPAKVPFVPNTQNAPAQVPFLDEMEQLYQDIMPLHPVEGDNQEEEEEDQDLWGNPEKVSGRNTLQGELALLASRLQPETMIMIRVLRADPLAGAIRAMRRPNFNPAGMLDIIFRTSGADRTGEGAVDLGGPRKEFFRLIIRQMHHHHCFEMLSDGMHLSLNHKALETGLYRTWGVLMTLSLVHGGPGPRCLAPGTFSRIADPLYREEIQLSHVSDPDMRQKIEEVNRATTADGFNLAIEDPVIDTILSLGGLYGSVTLALPNKESIVKLLVQTVTVMHLEPCFAQLREGLSTLGLLQSVQTHPKLWTEQFCSKPEPLSASAILGLFQEKRDAELGSNKQHKDDEISAWWADFLMDAESGLLEFGTTKRKVKVEDVLVFVTCMNVEPPCGFDPTPTVEFTGGRYPEASTCSNVLRLPCLHDNYDSFCNSMVEGIGNGQGFGSS